jgi:Glyoxalase/Bleomycin resistance protein/Dioxygenase superfamily
MKLARPSARAGWARCIAASDTRLDPRYESRLCDLCGRHPSHFVLCRDDIEKEHKKLAQLGVSFKVRPTQSGAVKVAVFDDTCGNFIQLVES